MKECRHPDRLSRSEHFGRDNGGDGVGRIVKAVAVFKDDRRENDDEKEQHVDLGPRSRRLGVLQNNLENHVAGIAATIDHFFEQVVKIAQKDDVLGVVIALVKIAQQLELEVVGFALDVLQFRVHLARGANVHSLAQLFHHREHSLGGLIEKLDLLGKTWRRQILRTNQHALANFLNRLWNFVERSGERLYVFAFQRRDECLG